MDRQRNRASFTTVENDEKKNFINSFIHYKNSLSGRLLDFKRFTNSSLDKTKRVITRVNYKKVITDVSVWFIETFIEGLTANFATSQLFQIEFSVPMIIAHGIIINQSISIIKRIGEVKNGPTNELPAEKYAD